MNSQTLTIFVIIARLQGSVRAGVFAHRGTLDTNFSLTLNSTASPVPPVITSHCTPEKRGFHPFIPRKARLPNHHLHPRFGGAVFSFLLSFIYSTVVHRLPLMLEVRIQYSWRLVFTMVLVVSDTSILRSSPTKDGESASTSAFRRCWAPTWEPRAKILQNLVVRILARPSGRFTWRTQHPFSEQATQPAFPPLLGWVAVSFSHILTTCSLLKILY